MRTSLLALALTLGACTTAAAQAAWFDLPVPSAALGILHVDTKVGTSLALERTIRVLHTDPRRGDPTPMVAEFERLLAALDAFELESQRVRDHAVSLAMAKNSSERDVLGDVLHVIGFRLRERRGVYTVEADRDNDAVALRKLLATAGVDTASLETRLNAGDTVMLIPTITVTPSPLSLDTWATVIFERPIPPRSVFSAIARDRQAALLLVGLAAMTPATRQYLERDRELLRHLYHDSAGAVAAFGEALRVDAAGRVALPGGSEAVALWEGLVDEKVERADRFARTLFDRDSGRLAYFVDTLGRLDPAHVRFALGLWITDRGARLERLRTLYRAFVDIDENWSVSSIPFTRPSYDPAMLVNLVQVDAAGAPAPPAFRRLWDEALQGEELPGDAAHDVGDPARDGMVDAGWLAEHMRRDRPLDRRALADRFAFGQRVFAAAAPAEMGDVLTALRAYGRFPSLMLALERIGIRDSTVYALAARRARDIDSVTDESLAVSLLGQFQGALSLLERIARTGAVDTARRIELVRSLVAVPITDGGYNGGLADWSAGALSSSLAGAGGETSLESRLLNAFAERGEVQAFEWEGTRYVADVTSTSLAGLSAIRKRQGGNSLDDVLALWDAVRAFEQRGLTIDGVRRQSTVLKTAGARIKPLRPWADVTDAPADVAKMLTRTLRDLDRLKKPKDAEKADRTVRPIVRIVDALLAETLTALAYAPWLDDAGLSATQVDLSHRHRFGLQARGVAPVEHAAWQPTVRDTWSSGAGGLTGSLLSIDLASASRRLRRLAADAVPSAPRINANAVDALVETLALENPREMRSSDLTGIGEAVARGRSLISAATSASALDELAARISMAGHRRQALAWASQAEPDKIQGLFSMSEVLMLGSSDGVTPIDAWGTTAEPVSGCWCLSRPSSATWNLFVGRPGTRLQGTAIPDVAFRVAEHLSVLKVPAALAPSVIAMAVTDFIDHAPPMYADDWLAIVGHAQQLSRETVEDYVAALVANGPVRAADQGTSP